MSTAIHQLSFDEARQIAVRAAGLDAHQPTTVLNLVRQIAMPRVALTPTVTPATDTQPAVTDGQLWGNGWRPTLRSPAGFCLEVVRV